MITTQKVTGILRKAGYRFSQYHASGMVRGWGRVSEGFNARKSGNVIRVDYERGSDARGPDTVTAQRLSEAAAALRAAGLTVAEAGTERMRWLEVS